MQLSLFPQNDIEDYIFADSRVVLYSSFFSLEEADRYFQELLSDISWVQSEIQIFGRKCLIPRLNAWYGEKSYTYSGNQMEAIPMTETLEEVRSKIEKISGGTFNSVLLNLYRDGNDTVGWHADDEPELDSKAPIASLSLGVMRRFILRDKNSSEKKEFQLKHGDLIVMYPPMQMRTYHTIPRMKRVKEPRINLTFRRLL